MVKNNRPTESPQLNVNNEDVKPRMSHVNTQFGDSDDYMIITDSLREEQTENENLRKQNRQLREGIVVLQNRLGNSGLSTLVRLESEEVLIPETSTELFDDLVRENTRLKGDLQSSISSSVMEVRRKELDSIKAERDELIEQLQQLRSIQGASTDAKDAEIARLNTELAETKGQVQGLASQCRELVLRQEEMQKSQGLHLDMQKLNLKEYSDELTHVRLQNSRLQIEVASLSGQLKEVLDSNNKWQQYDRQREEYIRKLTDRKVELESLSGAGSSGGLTTDQQLETDRILSQYKKKIQDSETERQLFEDENRSLRMQVHHLQQAITNLETKSQCHAPLSSEERERIALLESQIQVCTEDFQHERNDREKAQARITELQEENDLLQQQLNQFQTAHMSFLAERRTQAMNMYRQEYERQCGMDQNRGPNHPSHLLPRGPSYTGHIVADCEDDGDEDVIDIPCTASAASVRSETTHSPPPQQSVLDCPKCHRQFPVDEPMEFLEHTDKCNS